jgi:DNA-binding NarL/FixJ family response regulator
VLLFIWYNFEASSTRSSLKKSSPIKVIIADTAFIIRKGLRTLVQETPQFEYVTEVTDNASLQQALRTSEADVLIIDHCCDDCFSVEVIEDVKNRYPHLNILVISHEKSADEIKKIISLGIKNYLLKDCDEQEITDAIKACAKGDKYFCGQIIDALLEKELSSPEHCVTGSISERESEVISHLALGKRPKEIAALMNLSYHTVVTHKRNVYAKLGINNTVDLARYAAKTGLISH